MIKRFLQLLTQYAVLLCHLHGFDFAVGRYRRYTMWSCFSRNLLASMASYVSIITHQYFPCTDFNRIYVSRSSTCPECRNNCTRSQVIRLYLNHTLINDNFHSNKKLQSQLRDCEKKVTALQNSLCETQETHKLVIEGLEQQLNTNFVHSDVKINELKSRLSDEHDARRLSHVTIESLKQQMKEKDVELNKIKSEGKLKIQNLEAILSKAQETQQQALKTIEGLKQEVNIKALPLQMCKQQHEQPQQLQQPLQPQQPQQPLHPQQPQLPPHPLKTIDGLKQEMNNKIVQLQMCKQLPEQPQQPQLPLQPQQAEPPQQPLQLQKPQQTLQPQQPKQSQQAQPPQQQQQSQQPQQPQKSNSGIEEPHRVHKVIQSLSYIPSVQNLYYPGGQHTLQHALPKNFVTPYRYNYAGKQHLPLMPTYLPQFSYCPSKPHLPSNSGVHYNYNLIVQPQKQQPQKSQQQQTQRTQPTKATQQQQPQPPQLQQPKQPQQAQRTQQQQQPQQRTQGTQKQQQQLQKQQESQQPQ